MTSEGGQTPVSCNLCEEDHRIKWKCVDCNMLMCDKCKVKIHVKFKFAKDHKVVTIQEVGLHAEEIDFSNLSCKNHSKQSCVLFCKSCDYLVCPLCISETHNGHGLITIREGYEIKTDKLKTGEKKLNTNIDELKKRKAVVENVHTIEHDKFENTFRKIEAQNALLKNEIDKRTDELKSEITKRWEALQQSTKTEEKEISLHLRSLESKKSEVGDIIQSKDAKRVFVDSLGLVKSMQETVLSACTKFDSIPTFLLGITTLNIGSLENVSVRGEIKIINQFDTEISQVYFMSACSEDTLWISNCKTLQKVKIEGTSLNIIDKKDIETYGMELTPSKDLLLVGVGSVLKQLSVQTGLVANSKYKLKGLTLSAIHVNPDGKVAIGAFSGEVCYPAVGRRVVIVMDRSGQHETTYECDRQGNSIFTYVKDITRSKNGNIFVVDWLSENSRGRVVILSENGNELNTFSGHPEVNTETIHFEPSQIYISPSDIIIVPNRSYSIIYFLGNSGNYIGWCDTSKQGILYPRSFCITGSGRTFIGCVTPENKRNKAKIYEVNIL